jgi:hypothetical protein
MRNLHWAETQKNDYLKALKAVDYNKNTGVFTNCVGEVVTTTSKKGHKVIPAAKGRVIRADRFAVLVVTGKLPTDVVHLNGKLKDNTFENLQPVFERYSHPIVRH